MRIRTLFLTAAITLMATSAHADWRSPQQALDVVVNSSHGANKAAKADISVAYTRTEQGKPLYYVISRGDNAGFVIVNGWDNSDKNIVGYSDNGTFNPNKLPEGLKDMLNSYAEQILALSEAQPSGANKATKALRDNIEPMVKVKWNQSDPFNSLIYDGEYPTGCGPTAYAQIMSYWKYPKKYKDSEYDWDAMIADPAKTAQLMKDLGSSFGTDYSKGGSSTTVSTAMAKSVEDFGYDGGQYSISRSSFEYDEWEEILYSELAQNRPFLMYADRTKSTAYDKYTTDKGTAHLFIIDGYKDGLYHVNWGWGGGGDGFFQLSMQNNDYYINYTESQMAILNVMPDDGKPETDAIVVADDIEYWELCPPKMTTSYDEDLLGMCRRTSVAEVAYTAYIRFTNTETNEAIYFELELKDAWASGQKFAEKGFSANSLQQGVKYLMEAVYKTEGSDEYKVMRMPQQYRNAIVEVVPFTPDQADMEEAYPRVNLFELYFRTGCGYSPYGFWRIDKIKENYNDEIFYLFLQTVDVENYNRYGSHGTPAFFTNRSGGLYLWDKDNKPARYDKTRGKVVIDNIEVDPNCQYVTVDATARFNFSQKDADYRLAYILLEDSVWLHQKNNYYQQEDLKGTIWENEYVDVCVDHVARGIYPDFEGEKGSLPADIVGCTDYKHQFTFRLPEQYVSSVGRLHVAVFLYDAQYREILNLDNSYLPKQVYDNRVEVDLKTAGSLLEALGGKEAMDEIMQINWLVVRGPVNATDLQLIRMMGGRAIRGVNGVFATTDGHLKVLDMIGATIVDDGSDAAVMYDGMTPVNVSDNTLPNGLFSGTGINEIELPASLEKIEDNAFANCQVLRQVVIGQLVTTIGNDVFKGCTSLSTIYSLNEVPPTLGVINDFDYVNCTVYYPSDGRYYSADEWYKFDLCPGWTSDLMDKFIGLYTTPVDYIFADPAAIEGIYDINGRRVSSPSRGLNVIRYSDGSVRKLMVK